jgi:hypothetical protein
LYANYVPYYRCNVVPTFQGVQTLDSSDQTLAASLVATF